LAELAARATELTPDTPVIVYCVTGNRSEKAGKILRGQGFTYVFDLGSMMSY
jgi:rhodanese-related sulfurtransferase